MSANSPPAFSSEDIFTLDVSAAESDPQPTAETNQSLQSVAASFRTLQNSPSLATDAEPLARAFDIDMTRILGNNFLSLSQLQTNTLAKESSIVAYFSRPRIVMISAQFVAGSATTSGVTDAIDIINDSISPVGAPGVSQAEPFLFNMTRGTFENLIERNTIAAVSPGGQNSAIDNAYDVFLAAQAQGIGVIDITSSNLAALSALNIPADAKALISSEIAQGSA